MAPQRIFLDNDERYEVCTVKAAERPHLLSWVDHRNERSPDEEFPLLDGCDIPGWRKEGIAEVCNEMEGALNVGISCVLLRRETQLPIPRFVSRKWDSLRNLLYGLPSDSTPSINIADASVKIERKDDLFVTRFAFEWERKNYPVVVHGCTDGWAAMPKPQLRDSSTCATEPARSWTFENLLARFGDIMWRFSDNHGEMMSLKTYARYTTSIEGLTDDSPLAIYDAEFGEDTLTSTLLSDYDVPSCFSRDLFELAPSKNRPPFRWILIGPQRSGTGLHIDPLWTNAWVTVLEGCKRWILFPPNTPPEEICLQEPQIPSIIWFRDFYGKVTSPCWPPEWKPIEILQRPGETVFVPNGWPHLVLNLERTVAVTQNYASEFGPFNRMWQEVNDQEPDFAKVWCQAIREKRPDLAAQADDDTLQTIEG